MRTEGDFEGGEGPSDFYLSIVKEHMKVNRNQFSENPSQVTCKGYNVTLLNARHCRFCQDIKNPGALFLFLK